MLMYLQRVTLVLEFGCILFCRREPGFYFESTHRKPNSFTLILLTQFHFLNSHFMMKWQNKSRRRYLLVRFQAEPFSSVLCVFSACVQWHTRLRRTSQPLPWSIAHWFGSQSLEPAGSSRQPFGAWSVCVCARACAHRQCVGYHFQSLFRKSFLISQTSFPAKNTAREETLSLADLFVPLNFYFWRIRQC